MIEKRDKVYLEEKYRLLNEFSDNEEDDEDDDKQSDHGFRTSQWITGQLNNPPVPINNLIIDDKTNQPSRVQSENIPALHRNNMQLNSVQPNNIDLHVNKMLPNTAAPLQGTTES